MAANETLANPASAVDAGAAAADSPVDPIAAAAALFNSKSIALALVENGTVKFANAAFRRLFRQPGSMSGRRLLDLVEPADQEHLRIALSVALEKPVTHSAEIVRGDNSRFGVEFRVYPLPFEGRTIFVLFAQNLEQRDQVSAQLWLLAYSDPMTGLANRALLVDRLRRSALSARYQATPFAILSLDLDYFKPINDKYGHAAGDFVLQRVAKRLLACVHDTDTVARAGGDEFIIVLHAVKSRAVVESIAQRVIDQVGLPIRWNDVDLQVGVSVGLALFPEHATEVDRLLMAADSALYAAKGQGRGRYAWATAMLEQSAAPQPIAWSALHEFGLPEMDRQHAHLAGLLNELGCALRNAEPYEQLLKTVVDYTAFHFASEEALMRECHYSGTDAHAAIHRDLLTDIGHLDLSTSMNVSLVLCFLQEWLLRHIDGADRDLAAAVLAYRAAAAKPVSAA